VRITLRPLKIKARSDFVQHVRSGKTERAEKFARVLSAIFCLSVCAKKTIGESNNSIQPNVQH
jgi:hypothetical protein